MAAHAVGAVADMVAFGQVEVLRRAIGERALVVLDVDNTLADTWPTLIGRRRSHRRRLRDVEPLPGIRAVAHDRARSDGAGVVFLTHRPLWCRRVTRRWLRRHGYAATRRNVVLVGRPASKVRLIRRLSSGRRTTVWDDLTWGHEDGQVRRHRDVIDAIGRLGVEHRGWDEIVAVTGRGLERSLRRPDAHEGRPRGRPS